MGERLSVLVGTGVVAVGFSAAVMAGAGVAVATTETGSGTSTQSADSAASTPDPRKPARPAGDNAGGPAQDTSAAEGTDTDPVRDTDPADTDPADDEPPGDDRADDTRAVEHADEVDEVDEATEHTDEQAHASEHADALEGTPAAVEDVQPIPGDTPEVTAPSAPRLPVVAEPDGASEVAAAGPERASAPLASVTTLRAVSEAATAPRRQTLLSLFGAVVFNLYSVAIRVLGGPPQLPANSTVTVRSSSLTIDCGDGYEVPADWYVPEGVTPTRLIYFQHGFMAAGPFYSYTAARLAEATHSIVVATSLTSNFLACDGCWVGGSPMHRAVADLFTDGNTALADSARAAGYASTLLDGVRMVALVGHSAGGGLSAGAAGYMTQNGTFGALAGVVMLDGVGFGAVTPQALAKLPADFPIYNLAARDYFWNLSGVTNTAMQTWRPDGFNGVKLTRSSHGDSLSGGNPFVQIAMNLVTGWPRPENVTAAEMISAGWLGDMFSGSSTSGYYGAAGDTLTVETPSGTATARVLPGPAGRQTHLDMLFTFGAKILFGIDFATCADGEANAFTELLAPNTALSLDGTAKAGQSIAQHVCTG